MSVLNIAVRLTTSSNQFMDEETVHTCKIQRFNAFQSPSVRLFKNLLGDGVEQVFWLSAKTL